TIANAEAQASVNAPTSANPLYGKIEALIEHYDDARQPILIAAPQVEAPVMPEIQVLAQATLPILTVVPQQEAPAVPEVEMPGEPAQLILFLLPRRGQPTTAAKVNTPQPVPAKPLAPAAVPQKPAALPPLRIIKRRRNLDLSAAPVDPPTPLLHI